MMKSDEVLCLTLGMSDVGILWEAVPTLCGTVSSIVFSFYAISHHEHYHNYHHHYHHIIISWETELTAFSGYRNYNCSAFIRFEVSTAAKIRSLICK
jgi:hypothetical protein